MEDDIDARYGGKLVDDVDEENGPMTVIPGSHKHGQIPFEKSTEEENNVLGQSVHDPDKWGGASVPFVMKAVQQQIRVRGYLPGIGHLFSW